MPTYEYVCRSCGHAFEQFQKMTDPHLTRCPQCGKDELRRKIGTGAGIIFQGSGFYCNDYKGANASLPPPSHHHRADGGSCSCGSCSKPSEGK